MSMEFPFGVMQMLWNWSWQCNPVNVLRGTELYALVVNFMVFICSKYLWTSL
jgi:hypothetical protein